MRTSQDSQTAIPRVVFVGLASCFGCQINITNAEAYLVDVLGQIDLQYWQLTHSEPMPDTFDVAVIEGAVTTEEAVEVLKEVREKASTVITIGACAHTAGIPGMAYKNYEGRLAEVYGEEVPYACATPQAPLPVHEVIKVDEAVLCCPVDPLVFVDTLQRVLYGSNKFKLTSTMCGECKRNEKGCFWAQKVMCMGLVTKSGCGARCPNLGRPCSGCAGLSPDANIACAHYVCQKANIPASRFDDALGVFNEVALVEQAKAGEGNE